MLYIVSTPIGNLDDFSIRAIDTLKKCDYILCEDTRHSLKLLLHYQIQKPLVSFHQWNEAERGTRIIDDLQAGKTIALISDAGTPLISDPGFDLVQACQKANVTLTCVPGPCALISGLVLSGMATLPFQFVGFLPKKKSERATTLEELLEYAGTTVCYETAERIKETLEIIDKLAPQRKLAVAREITKRFERVAVGCAQELLKEAFLGEIVFCIEGAPLEENALFSKEFLQLCVEDLAKTHSTKEAIALVAKQLRVPKRQVYSAVHK